MSKIRVVKKFLTPLIALLVIGAGIYFVVQFQLNKGGDEEEVAPPIATVERGDVETIVEVSGDISPLVETDIKSEISGRIIAINVEEGQFVEEGQALVELDDRDLIDEKASVTTDIAIARLQHEKAKRDFERAESLYDRELLSLQQYLDTETAYLLAEKSLKRSELRLNNVETRLSRTTIHAPMSGVVLKINVIVGQVSIGATSVNNGTTLMQIANLNEMIITTHINQIDVSKLKNKMSANFTVDSLPEEKYSASISTIAPVATTKNNIKGYEVTLDITGKMIQLKPGMTADVTIPVDSVRGVLTVPVTALFQPEEESSQNREKMIVYIPKEGNLSESEKREVHVGVTNFSRAEIKSGLRENERVLLVRPSGAGISGSAPSGRS